MAYGVTDYMDAGIWPLQDHEFGIEVDTRLMMTAVRISRMQDPEDSDDPEDSLVELAEEKNHGTIGDIHPWFFWQTENPGERGMGSWAQSFASMVVAGGNGGFKPGAHTGHPVSPSQLLPFRTATYKTDVRFKRAYPNTPKCFPIYPVGTVMLVTSSMEEQTQHDLMNHVDPRLIASHVDGPGGAGTLVCDLQPDGEICMSGSTEPGKGGRHARLQSMMRVIALPKNKGIQKLGTSPGNMIAWNCALTGQDRIGGYGATWIRMVGGAGPITGGPIVKPPGGPITPPAGPGLPPRGGGWRTGGANFGSGPNSNAPEPGTESANSGGPLPGGDKSGGGNKPGGPITGGPITGPPQTDPDEFEMTPCDTGEFSPKPKKSHGVSFMAHIGACGPLHGGAGGGDKHFLENDADGNPMTSGHIGADAYIFQNSDRDGPWMFEGDYPKELREWKFKTHCHIAFDKQQTHKWVSGSKQGKWRVYTTVPYCCPDTKTPVPPTGPPTGNPMTPITPGPMAPMAPGPVIPITPMGSGMHTPMGGMVPIVGPITPPAGPGIPPRGGGWRTTGGPTAPGAPKPGGPGKPGGPITGGPEAPVSPPGGGPGYPPGGGEDADDDQNDSLRSKMYFPPGSGGHFARGGAGGVGTTQANIPELLGELTGTNTGKFDGGNETRSGVRGYGVRGRVGDTQAEDENLWEVHHPFREGFAGMSFRPQLWERGYPGFIHNPEMPEGILMADELSRPTALQMDVFGGMDTASGDWDYVQAPESSRARGGTIHGGVLFHPPRFQMEDYFQIGSDADTTPAVDSVGYTESHVMHAPGVGSSFGLPNRDGSLADGGGYIRVYPSNPTDLEIGTRSSGADVSLITAGISGGEEFVTIVGTGSMKIPTGTTGERPAISIPGEVRVNTTDNVFEWYAGGAWVQSGSGGGSTTFIALTDTPAGYGTANDVVTTDGATTLQYETPVVSTNTAGALVRLDGSGRIDGGLISFPTGVVDWVDLGDTAASIGSSGDVISHDGSTLAPETPIAAYTGTAGELIRTDGSGMIADDLINFPAPTIATWESLSDTPASFVANKIPSVNAGATAMIFAGPTIAATGELVMGSKEVQGVLAGLSAGNAVELVQAVAAFVAKTGSTMTGALVMNDNVAATFGTGSDATALYNGTDLIIKPDVVGSGAVLIDGRLELWDSDKLTLGTGQDAEIYYDGTDLIIDPKVAGSGHIGIPGSLEVADGYSTSGAARNAHLTVWEDNAFGMELAGTGTAPALRVFGRSTDTDAIHFGTYTANSTTQSSFTQKMVMTAAGKFGVGVTAPNESIEASGIIRANGGFSDNGTAGIDVSSFTWYDRDSGQHDVTISGGLVTEWTYTP